VQRDTTRLLRAAIIAVADDALDADAVEDLVGAATSGLDPDDATPFWSLVELLTRARSMSDRELQLVTEILGVVARVNARPRRA
jgi:hypothetical protein